MNLIRKLAFILLVLVALTCQAQRTGFTNAADFGFLPDATGVENVKALQKAVDRQGTILCSEPGTYKMAGTVYIGSNTTLELGNGVILKKVSDEVGPFTHVILNKGALTKEYDQHIIIRGLEISVNGVDKPFSEVFGLRGQLAFFYVKDLRIEGFRCYDLARMQFGVHVCTFEDLILDDTIIKGQKDGIHLGKGNRFTISNAILETMDDAIALNAQDYPISNPEQGWIENGIVGKCWDLAGQQKLVGYFCRILSGAWIDWKQGMEVQMGTTVVSNGQVYRVDAEPDGKKYISKTQPSHDAGAVELDGIRWVKTQDVAQYDAGVRNVTFRDIYLEKPRQSFSLHMAVNKYNRSFYEGAIEPSQDNIIFDNIRVLHDGKKAFLGLRSPANVVTIINSSLRNSGIETYQVECLENIKPSTINIFNTTFNCEGEMLLLENRVENKTIYLNTANNTVAAKGFSAKVMESKDKVVINSDLPGLN
ncbi:hypothetical protein [Yeosuana marina]|uniref:hypothetical protein n=1 Tax=Yeosuana marina TaxID=1565536 RepID=UPI0030C85B7B